MVRCGLVLAVLVMATGCASDPSGSDFSTHRKLALTPGADVWLEAMCHLEAGDAVDLSLPRPPDGMYQCQVAMAAHPEPGAVSVRIVEATEASKLIVEATLEHGGKLSGPFVMSSSQAYRVTLMYHGKEGFSRDARVR